MLKIALTGPSGGGKGYVSSLLADMGVPSLDTDAVVHRLYDDPGFSAQVEEAVGAPVRGAQGTVDRKLLGAAVYGDEKKMQALLSLVYPRVHDEIAAFLLNAGRAGCPAAAVDAPQLFEAGFESEFDRILCVSAPKDLRLRRIMLRDGVTRAQALTRMAHQKCGRDYEKLAHASVRSTNGADVQGQLTKILAGWGVDVK